MLNKSDLKAIKQIVQDVALTKDDAKKFATKDDLKKLVTKNDANNLATKDDLKQFATKKDLIGLARIKEIDDLKITFIDNLAKWKDELFTKIDSVLGRVITAEEENVILRAKEESREEVKKRIETRLNKLESIHPSGRHQYP